MSPLHHAFCFMLHAQSGKLSKGCEDSCMSSICTVVSNFSLGVAVPFASEFRV